ncbi:MAG: hypothetical protein AAF387_05930 [Pseudomonadota bacterium]
MRTLHALALSAQYLAVRCLFICACVVITDANAIITNMQITGGDAFGTGAPDLNPDPNQVFSANVFDDDDLHGFDEQQNLDLSENLELDDIQPGATSHVLGVGSTVSSHVIVFDPLAPTSATRSLIGFVEFDQPILGVYTTNAGLNGSAPILGLPAFSYNVTNGKLEGSDSYTISGNRLDIEINAASPGDYIRVVTGTMPTLGFNECGVTDQTIFGTITGGDSLAAGGVFRQICEPIGPVGADNFQRVDLLAFEEQQNVTLVSDLQVDDTNAVPAGATVSSFYVVFDPTGNGNFTVEADVVFPGTIVGIIEDLQLLQDSDFLGDASATYLSPGMRGLENFDNVSGIGTNTLTLRFGAGSPGDVVRVILSATPASLPVNVCPPAQQTLTGAVTGGDSFTSGGVFIELCDPIGNVGNNNYQTDDLFAFAEQRGTQLAGDLMVDEGPNAVIPVGTNIDSYYVAYDPSFSSDIEGTITFPKPILGVLTTQDSLNASDDGNPIDLGNPTANYLNPSLRGLEENADSVSVNGNELTISFDANTPGDYIRVITESTVVPETQVPTMPLWAVFLAGAALLACWNMALRRVAIRNKFSE